MKQRINSNQSGFTLIEAIVVVAILAIISVIAANYYEDQKRRSYRTDAVNAIQRFAQLQERHRTINGVYDDLATIGGSSSTQQGKYTIDLPTQTDDTYTIRASAIGPQLQDEDCRTFSLTHTGIRSSTDDSSTVSTGAASRCWPR